MLEFGVAALNAALPMDGPIFFQYTPLRPEKRLRFIYRRPLVEPRFVGQLFIARVVRRRPAVGIAALAFHKIKRRCERLVKFTPKRKSHRPPPIWRGQSALGSAGLGLDRNPPLWNEIVLISPEN